MSLRSKCDRAVVAYLQSKGVCQNIYPALYSLPRALPNVTVLCHSGRREVPLTGNYRFQLRNRVENSAVIQPIPAAPGGQPLPPANTDIQRLQIDAATEAVYIAMMGATQIQNGTYVYDENSLKATAQAITSAGRALAVDASNGADPAQVQRAKNNADMVDFTILALYETGLDGGNPKHADGASDVTFWAEDLLFEIEACDSNVD